MRIFACVAVKDSAMSLFINTTLGGLELGLCYAILAIGLYISYTMLDFADLGVDGIFPLGGVVGTIVMYRLGIHPVLAIFVAAVVGALSGGLTGFLHVKCKISGLLCGIIVMTGMLSVTLALTMLLSDTGFTGVIFNYRALGIEGLFNGEWIDSLSNRNKMLVIIGILFVVVLVVKVLVDLFLKTKAGFMIRATGDNEQMVVSLGKDPGSYKIMGLMIADALTGVAGCLYAQMMNQYDNNCGSGKVVIALVAVIMGVSLFGNIRCMKGTTMVILGAIVYSLALNYFTLIDTNGTFLKLFNAVFFALVLIIGNKRKDFHKIGWKAFKKPKKESVKNG